MVVLSTKFLNKTLNFFHQKWKKEIGAPIMQVGGSSLEFDDSRFFFWLLTLQKRKMIISRISLILNMFISLCLIFYNVNSQNENLF